MKTSEKIKVFKLVRRCSLLNIEHPEWGPFGVSEDRGLWFEIIGRSGTRTLSKTEADKFWKIIEKKI